MIAAEVQRPSIEQRGSVEEVEGDSQFLTAIDQYDYFEEARHRLATMETSSTCKRIATIKLLTTCDNLQSGARDEDLESVQNLYAAHLAICELGGAAAKIPQSCRLHLPAGTDELPEVLDAKGKSQLQACISTLHSKSQWWTSYSNNQRDAYLWCKVMRPGFDQGS